MYQLEEWKKEFSGRRILIWGYGREGKSSYRIIRKLCPNQRIYICDTNIYIRQDVIKQTTNTEYFLQSEVDFSQYDIILKSPGIVVDDNINLEHLTSQTELFLKHYAKQVVGITGTKGKSTTTSLLHTILSTQYRSHLVGNIGVACFDVIEDMKENDIICFELSCHQMEYTKYSPHIAVFLNLYEEHLDHYKTMEQYQSAKANILRYQSKNDVAIVHQALTFPFCMLAETWYIGKDIYAKKQMIQVFGKKLEVRKSALIGKHNYQNIAIVYAIAHNIFNISDYVFLQALSTFVPLAHRLQDLGEFEGIRFVDDSISTIGQSCIQAIEALHQVQTVLVGGMDRGIDYTDFKYYLYEHPNLQVIFMYATGKRIYHEMEATGQLHDHIYLCKDLKEAVRLAKKITKPHFVCLLSPAASSYDHFKNFEERGDIFRKLAFTE